MKLECETSLIQERLLTLTFYNVEYLKSVTFILGTL